MKHQPEGALFHDYLNQLLQAPAVIASMPAFEGPPTVPKPAKKQAR